MTAKRVWLIVFALVLIGHGQILQVKMINTWYYGIYNIEIWVIGISLHGNVGTCTLVLSVPFYGAIF